MSCQRYGYHNALASIQIPKNTIPPQNHSPEYSPEEARSQNKSPFGKGTLSTISRVSALPSGLNIDSKERRNTYLQNSTNSKRPRPYCPLSRQQDHQEELQQIRSKGLQCIGSEEWLEYINALHKKGRNDHQILKQMKEVRSNNIYLSVSSSKSQNMQVFYESGQKQTKGSRPIEGQDQGCTIDQLSKIDEQETLSLDYKIEEQEGLTAYGEKYVQKCGQERKETKETKEKLPEKYKGDLIVIKEEDDSIRPLVYPQPRRSPLHSKIISRQERNASKSPTIRSGYQLISYESDKKRMPETKPLLIYQQKRYSDFKYTKREKENIQIQPKNIFANSKKTVRKIETVWEENYKEIVQGSPCNTSNIYNMDFKLAKPDPNKYSISRSNLPFNQTPPKTFTPVKRRWNQLQGQTIRAADASRDRSSNCSRSVSRGKLSLVSASHRQR